MTKYKTVGRHCTNAPAYDRGPDDWCWYLNNKIHRYYGYASSNGYWYLHGKINRYSCLHDKTKKIKAI